MFAIPDACTDDHGVEGLQVAVQTIRDFGDRDRVSSGFECGLHAGANPECLTVRGRIGEECVGHM